MIHLRTTENELKYLSEQQIEALFRVIKSPWDRAMFRLMYHRGLRASEPGLLDLGDWHDEDASLYVRRLKGSKSARYPLLPAGRHPGRHRPPARAETLLRPTLGADGDAHYRRPGMARPQEHPDHDDLGRRGRSGATSQQQAAEVGQPEAQESGLGGQKVSDNGSDDHRRKQMKAPAEKCIRSKHLAKLPVPTKEIRNMPEKATSAAEVQKADRDQRINEVEEHLCRLTCVQSKELANRIADQMTAMQIWGSSDVTPGERFISAIDMMAALRPVNGTEALLTVQMVGVHGAATKFLADARRVDQSIEGRDANVVRATRRMRLFNEQLEVMQKLKGKAGQPKVTVEHVHVYQGGQAIVGAVNAGKEGRRGGGAMTKPEKAPQEPRRGWLKNGNRPGDFSNVPRCGAKTRRGSPCQCPAMTNGRCRIHGGLSTGPKTAEGIARIRRAVTKHGHYSAAARLERQRYRALLREGHDLIRRIRNEFVG